MRLNSLVENEISQSQLHNLLRRRCNAQSDIVEVNVCLPLPHRYFKLILSLRTLPCRREVGLQEALL